MLKLAFPTADFRFYRHLFLRVLALILSALVSKTVRAQQTTYTWEQLKQRFVATNPTLQAGRLNVQESQALEITAYLRPNPDFSLASDQFTFHPIQPFALADQIAGISYLHERGHKRELRRDVAQKATLVARSQQEDSQRSLLFSLRNAFVQALQAKAVLANAKENLSYYDHELQINRERLKAGDIAEVDEDRLELQRIQFESDVQTSIVNVRTAKIQILTLLNDRSPIDLFEVTGAFDFTEQIPPLEELRKIALDARPDLAEAIQSVQEAELSHRLAIANGTSDPTFGFDGGRNPPALLYVGFSVSFPLRIFDRNQGEKERTAIDITRTQRLLDASRAQVFSDVDSAFETINGNLALLKPYKATYLPLAAKVRETVSYAYQRGAATLLEFLDAQKSYRDVELSYLNLVGSFLASEGQLNMAVGRDTLQ